MKHGNGIYRYKDGDVYEGDFVRDLKEGKGRIIYASGSLF